MVIFMTSNCDPLIFFNVFKSLSFQRGSGAPLMNQFDPLSARIIPYFFNARRITCIAANVQSDAGDDVVGIWVEFGFVKRTGALATRAFVGTSNARQKSVNRSVMK